MVSVIRAIEPFRIKYNDVFHLRNLYNMMHEYLLDELWMGFDKPMGGPYPNLAHWDIEKLYMERHHQKSLHAGGTELWIWWRLRKSPFGKNQGYYDYHLDIDFHGVYLQKQEIMHQGKKIKVDQGEIEIRLRPKLVRTEMAEKWQTHWLLKHFHEMYEQRIISQDLDKLEKDLWRHVYKLQGVIKAYLNLRNFIPVPEPIHPKQFGMEGNF